MRALAVEKRMNRAARGLGLAYASKRGHVGWGYNGRGKDLQQAYAQVFIYGAYHESIGG